MLYSETDREKRYINNLSGGWLNSGLINAGQQEVINTYTKLDLRVSNGFMQALFFFFTCVLCYALVFITDTFFGISSHTDNAIISLLYSIVFYILAEYLVRVYRLFNFGIENALVFVSVMLFNTGIGVVLNLNAVDIEAFTIIVCLSVAACSAWVAYRFGGTFWSLVCLVAVSVIPFQLSLSPMNARLGLGSILLLAFAYTYYKGRLSVFTFRKHEWKIVQGCLLTALYLSLNLRLSNMITNFRAYGPALAPHAGFSWVFYWATYLFVWALPAALLVVGIKKHKRLCIDVGIITSAITLITNKDYLGFKHYSWDPAVFGFLLVGVVIVTMRLVKNSGKENGYTAENMLKPEHHGLDVAAIAMGIAGQAVSLPGEINKPDSSFSGGTAGDAGTTRTY